MRTEPDDDLWVAIADPSRRRVLDLFAGRRQLIVYRAFLEPGVHGWPDHACVGCSMVADQVAHVAHLHARNTTLAFAFIRDGDRVFRTYFINNRGDEAMGSTWSYLDMTALGRHEEWEDSPEGYPQEPPYGWWVWHDEAPRARRRSSRRDRALPDRVER